MTRRGRMREWHLNWSNVHNPHIRTNPYFCSHTLQYHGGIYHRLYSLLHTHTCQYSRFSVKASTGNTQVQNSISTAALSAPSLWQTWNLLPWTNRAQQIRRWLWFSVCARNNGGVGSCGCLYSINNHSGWAGPEGHLEMLGGQEHGSWLQQQLSWWHLNSKDNTQDSLNQFCLPATAQHPFRHSGINLKLQWLKELQKKGLQKARWHTSLHTKRDSKTAQPGEWCNHNRDIPTETQTVCHGRTHLSAVVSSPCSTCFHK